MNTTDKILEELDVLIEDPLRNSKPIGAIFCDARRTIADYRARIAEFWDALDALRSERDEAREDLEFRRGLYKFQEEHLEAARRERDEARVERDRLAELLENALKYIHGCPFKANCIAALQSLNQPEL